MQIQRCTFQSFVLPFTSKINFRKSKHTTHILPLFCVFLNLRIMVYALKANSWFSYNRIQFLQIKEEKKKKGDWIDPVVKVLQPHSLSTNKLNELTITWISKVISFCDVMRYKICRRSRRTRNVCWDQYLSLSRSNSLSSNISIEQAGDSRYKNITLRTNIIVNDLLKFWSLRPEVFPFSVCRYYSLLQYVLR